MKKFIFFISLSLVTITVLSKKEAVFDELTNPDSMVINESAIFISQQAEVFIYDLKTFKLKDRFGKSGQGPREIPPFPFPISRIPLMRINSLSDKLFISAMGKILLFTKEGKFISESKFPAQKIQNYINLIPLGEDLLCQWTLHENDQFFITARIIDKNFQFKKELKRKMVYLHGGKMDLFTGSLTFEVSKDRIFVAGEDLSIDIFDKNGKLQKHIKQPHEPIKFSEDMRKQFDETLKFMFKAFYDQFKIMIYYPENLPIIFNLQCSGSFLYVFTWKHQGENRDLFIFNQDGTFIKKTTFPLQMVTFIIPYPFDITNKDLYQLVDNEETEKWELHKNSIH